MPLAAAGTGATPQPRAERPAGGKAAGCPDRPPSLRPTFPSSLSAGTSLPRLPLTALPPVPAIPSAPSPPLSRGLSRAGDGNTMDTRHPGAVPGIPAVPAGRKPGWPDWGVRGAAGLAGHPPASARLVPIVPPKAPEFRCLASFTTSVILTQNRRYENFPALNTWSRLFLSSSARQRCEVPLVQTQFLLVRPQVSSLLCRLLSR